MDDTEKFLFDLQGFLHVPEFLAAEEVKSLNDAFDANADKVKEDGNSNTAESKTLAGDRKRDLFDGMLAWRQPWCQPFRDLLTHPKSIPYLDELLGRGWRMDHSPFMLQADAGAEGLVLHGSTSRTFFGGSHYVYRNGEMRCGMIVLQFQLTHIKEGDGGLCCVPGSHKANFPCPGEIASLEKYEHLAYNIPCEAGDMVIFNEATIHGTLPWTAGHPRRSLLYRYSPWYLHYAGGYHQSNFPDWVAELTDAQRAVLEPPYLYNRPLVEADGESVTHNYRPLAETDGESGTHRKRREESR
jgi:ectoine hydroxylase-related dioxygenase (phytanoyl-CoA dioxygenase family)